MNYKAVTLEQIEKLNLLSNLDNLSDDDAFDLMQRYKELTEYQMESDSFEEFKSLPHYDYKQNIIK